jgi:hypothetical protein
VDVLVDLVFSDTFDAGVRFLIDSIGTSSAAGRAPVIIMSASSMGSGVFPNGFLLVVRVAFVIVTRPSLSSLRLFAASTVLTALETAGFAVSLGGATFATRVVVDVIFVRFGRGIFVIDDYQYS